MNLNHWLKKTPQPVTVLADDKRIPVPKNARAYRDLVETIKSLDPDKLVCLDKDDQVLRSTILNKEEGEEEAAAPLTQEQSDLQLFAKLLAEGYDRGAKTNQPLLQQAMEFCDRQGQRLAKAETEIDKLRAHIHKLTLQIGELSLLPEPEPAKEESVVETMLAGALAAQAQGFVTPINKPPAAKGAKP